MADDPITTRTRVYTYHEESGHSEALDAADMDEAVEMAEELARSGGWGDDGASVRVSVTEDEAGEETDRRDLTVEVEPNHRALIGRAAGDAGDRLCGLSPDDHDWTSEGEGGCSENPGVWSTGGTSMLFASHCRTCGLRRREISVGSQRNPGDHDRVEYAMPERWCEDCQADDCDCAAAD